jgi:hypothetical protein
VINCCCSLVDWAASAIVGVPQTAIRIKKSRIFLGIGDHDAGRGAVRSRIKKRVAKPEEHFGNALVALPEPLPAITLQERYGNLKKSSARPGRRNERLMRWEGAVNERRSDAGGRAEELRPRSPSAGNPPSSPTASPARHPQI